MRRKDGKIKDSATFLPSLSGRAAIWQSISGQAEGMGWKQRIFEHAAARMKRDEGRKRDIKTRKKNTDEMQCFVFTVWSRRRVLVLIREDGGRREGEYFRWWFPGCYCSNWGDPAGRAQRLDARILRLYFLSGSSCLEQRFSMAEILVSGGKRTTARYTIVPVQVSMLMESMESEECELYSYTNSFTVSF